MLSDKENNKDRILVFLGADADNREQFLEISAQEQILSPESNPSMDSTGSSGSSGSSGSLGRSAYYRVQFQYMFPFKVDDLPLTQVGTFIHFLNRLIDLPGFELDELENQTYYRYVWLTKEDAVDFIILNGIINMIGLSLIFFSQNLERLGTGKTSLNELLKEVIDITTHYKKQEESKRNGSRKRNL